MSTTLPSDKPIIKPRPSTLIPTKDCTPDRIKEFYREQADWYEWMTNHTQTQAEKVRRELVNLRQLIELKQLELIDLEADARSYQDVLETYRELTGDTNPTPETQQSECFD